MYYLRVERAQYTMKSIGSSDKEILARFSLKTNGGNVLKLRTMVLPKGRYEEFIDLFMNYFVPQEKIHIDTGILESTEALNEYRNFLNIYINNDSVQNVICCLDSDETTSEIYGGFVLKLYRKSDPCDDAVEFQTKPMEKFEKIDKELDSLVPIADLMTKYNVDQCYEIMYAFVRPDKRQMGILNKLVEASFLMCRINRVPLMGTWCTSVISQKVAESVGSELEYEISFKDIGERVDVNFEDDTCSIKFMVKRIFGRSNL